MQASALWQAIQAERPARLVVVRAALADEHAAVDRDRALPVAGLGRERRGAVAADDDDIVPVLKSEFDSLRVLACSQQDVVSPPPEVLDDRREQRDVWRVRKVDPDPDAYRLCVGACPVTAAANFAVAGVPS